MGALYRQVKKRAAILGCLLIPFCTVAAGAAADRLAPGDPLPALRGESLSGQQVELPAAKTGSPRVLVFSFAKAAGTDSRQWTERLAKDFGPDSPVALFRIMELESAPKLFRGMAVSGMKGGIPKAQWDASIVLYRDEALWKSRLGVTHDKHAYVVVLDGDGRIRWMSTDAFSEAGYAELKKELSR